MKEKHEKLQLSKKNIMGPLTIWLLFIGIAIWMWKLSGSIFYLFNFGYIGTSVTMGIFLTNALPKTHKPWGRRIAQLLVGCYMLLFLGLLGRENM